VVTCAYLGPYVWDGAENHDPKQLHISAGFPSRRIKQEENQIEAIPSFPATQYKPVQHAVYYVFVHSYSWNISSRPEQLNNSTSLCYGQHSSRILKYKE
jgi:hypothetical protein